MSESDAIVTERDLARTFDGGAYENAWNAVVHYRSAMDYAREHDCGSSATASALDLPRSRIRTWVDDGGKPDAVRAIETAHDKGWIEIGYDDRKFPALNALVANVFSGASISADDYRPSFALNHLGLDSHVIDALELADVEYAVVHGHDPDRATEVRPSAHSPVLGRVLAAMGAPIGPKADQHLALPAYLEDAPLDVRETFVYAYLENRASEHEGKQTLTVKEDRNTDYLRSLAELIGDVADGRVTVGDRQVTISAEAARNLGTVR